MIALPSPTEKPISPADRRSTSHFDDENEPCSSFGVRRHYKSSVQFTRRSTIISTKSVIS